MATGMSSEHLQKAAQETKQQARTVMNDATESVRSSLTQQKDGAASSLGSFAEALRKAAKESPGDGQSMRMAEWAADGIESVSSTLRSKDLDGMLREVQSFARKQPVAFLAAAVAAGFLATRFLKAGTEGENATGATRGGERREPLPQNFPPPGAGGVSATERADISSTTPF
jgi:nucleoid DNA-binding protein